MVHLSWPLRACMSGDGYLSGGVAAGLPVAASLCLALAAREASDCFLSLLFACKAPAPSRGPRCLASARFSTPRPRLLASARICARNLVSSLSLKPHVDFLGVRGRRLLSRRNGGRKSSLPSALQRVTFRHVAERSVAWFFFSLLGRRCAKGAHSENERRACRDSPSDAGGERDGPKRGHPAQGNPE